MATVSGIPAEPTSAQCDAKERVSIPGSTAVAHAVWWPQMGGKPGKAVATIGDCSTVWLWHDGQLPLNGREPRQIHLCGYGEWIETFEWLKSRYEQEFDEEPEPYVWVLPQGVTREQAQEVYEKIVAWGLWEVDPGGFRIRTYEEAHGPCEPIPCPPFQEITLQASAERMGPAPIDQNLAMPAKLDSEWMDSWMGVVSAATAAGFLQIDLLPAPGPAQMPRIITLPEGVNAEEADRWVQGCIQLGIIEAGTGGVLYLPHGQQL
jgi:hypothetical protein